VAATWRPGVLSGLGGFSGMFAPDLQKYPDPVLVSGTDGVGTKLRIAFLMNKHDTIGQDAVAMCVNDILTQGAEPLFFLDYLAVGKLEPDKAATIVGGIAAGCKLSGCALIGGEMAEMPGFYAAGEYDIAGFAVGIVNRDRIIDGSGIREGDVLVGLPSSGIHSNGFSLVRKLFLPETLEEKPPEFDCSLGEVLLTPTRIYVQTVLPLLEKLPIQGMVHITGGGLTENIPRVLPAGLGVTINLNSWRLPVVFRMLQERGKVADDEMRRTFNMGIGFVIIVHREDLPQLTAALADQEEPGWEIGAVVKGSGVTYQ
jgi:phosphoribosylformylglycinamidine cyclo-ligase